MRDVALSSWGGGGERASYTLIHQLMNNALVYHSALSFSKMLTFCHVEILVCVMYVLYKKP